MIVAETDKKIVGLNAADGKLLWEIPFAVSGRGYNASTPIASGNVLIYCGSGRGANAVRIEKTAQGFALKELWKNPDHSVQFNTPVLKDDRLYGLSADNILFCVNAKNGQTGWTAPLARAAAAASEPPAGRAQGGRGGRPGFGSVVDAGPVLMVLSPESELVVFQPSQTAFNEVSRVKVAPSPTYAHPVVSGSRLIVKDQDAVMLYTL